LDPERLADAVEALDGMRMQLAALSDAADMAGDLASTQGVAAWFSEVVCSALESAHMREMVFGGQQGTPQPQGRHPLPRHVKRQFGIIEARQTKRKAQGGSEEWAQAKQGLKRRLRQAHRAAKGLFGEKLEQLALADPVGFYLRYHSSPRADLGSTALAVFQHFERLLGAPVAAEVAAPAPTGEAAAATAPAEEAAIKEAPATPAAAMSNGVLNTPRCFEHPPVF
jgi:hypothetical protein